MNNSDITNALVETFKNTRKALNALEKARGAVQGPYNNAVLIANQADSADAFKEGFEGFETAVKTDGRLAGCVNAKPRKKPAKDGSKYTVPGSIMNAKSTLLAAFDLGIELVAEEGPKAFSAIRKEVKEAKEAIAASEASEDDKLRAQAGAICEDILAGLADWGSLGLADMVEALGALRDEITATNAESEADAEEIAKAA